MSLQVIQALYFTFFASDKDLTNDVIGGFGLGSKAAFAISEAFTVKSVKDGELTVASVYLDKVEPKPVIVKHMFNVEEPNGTTVTVPVDDRHKITTIQNEARTLFKYWEVLPNIINHDYPIEKVTLRTTSIYAMEPANIWHKSYDLQATFKEVFNAVIVGNISYDIPHVVLDKAWGSNSETLKQLLKLLAAGDNHIKHKILPLMSIGDLELAPSRERIEITPDNVEVLNTAISTIAQELMKDVITDAEAFLKMYLEEFSDLDTSVVPFKRVYDFKHAVLAKIPEGQLDTALSYIATPSLKALPSKLVKLIKKVSDIPVRLMTTYDSRYPSEDSDTSVYRLDFKTIFSFSSEGMGSYLGNDYFRFDRLDYSSKGVKRSSANKQLLYRVWLEGSTLTVLTADSDDKSVKYTVNNVRRNHDEPTVNNQVINWDNYIECSERQLQDIRKVFPEITINVVTQEQLKPLMVKATKQHSTATGKVRIVGAERVIGMQDHTNQAQGSKSLTVGDLYDILDDTNNVVFITNASADGDRGHNSFSGFGATIKAIGSLKPFHFLTVQPTELKNQRFVTAIENRPNTFVYNGGYSKGSLDTDLFKAIWPNYVLDDLTIVQVLSRVYSLN
jgi:hypothetical protein